MSDPATVTAIFAGLAVIITQIGVIAVNIIQAKQTRTDVAATRAEVAAVQVTAAAAVATVKKVDERVVDVQVKVDNVEGKVEAVHIATNSLVSRLVKTTKDEAHAAGLKEGLEQSNPSVGTS
jgi:hypothetical protein